MHKKWISKRMSVALILSMFVFLGLIYISYDLGSSHGVEMVLSGDAIKDGFERQAQSLENKNRTIYQELALLRRQSKIDQVTIEELKKSHKDLMGELVSVREELSFYRQVIAPEKISSLISLQTFKIEPQVEKNTYQLNLTLVQTKKRRTTLVGSVEILVEGTYKGKAVTYSYADITTGAKKITFSFKYFQNIAAKIKIPNGFTPAKVFVRAYLKGKNKTEVNEDYSWAELN